jgi:hypothetical protein
MVGILAEDLCNNNRYAKVHEAKMSEAEGRGWKNIGRSFEDLKPSKHYSGVTPIGKLSRPETVELQNAKKLGFTDRDIRTMAGMEAGSSRNLKGFFITREKVFESGWIDWTFENTKSGERYFIEAAVSDFRATGPENIKMPGPTEYEKAGAIPGLESRFTGGGIIRFYVTSNGIDPGLRKTAMDAHRIFYAASLHWKESFYRHVLGTWESVRSPTPSFRTGTDKDFDPVTHIDARVNVPSDPRSRQPKYYELRVFTAHPVATAHEFGLAGTDTGLAPMTVPTMRGLGEPGWRFKEYR